MAKNIQRIDLKTVNDEPVFRIGLFEGQDFIDFRIEGKFNVENERKFWKSWSWPENQTGCYALPATV